MIIHHKYSYKNFVRPLFDWHPLISGDVNSVHLAGISVRGRTYRDDEIPQEEVYKHVINWVE
jgi:uncharacterized cysteine cluster protein YcgN (CxxCxxCC family)